MPIDTYLAWKAKYAAWVAVLDRLRNAEEGFSFTEANPAPHVEVKVKVPKDAPYLAEMQRIEGEEAVAAHGDHLKDRAAYDAGLTEYTAMGRLFHDEVTDPSVPVAAKRDLLVCSEANHHLFHNAAVLWLEGATTGAPRTSAPTAPPSAQAAVSSQPSGPAPTTAPNTIATIARQDYEDVLKHLWLFELVRRHPHWDLSAFLAQPATAPERFKAFVKYTIGHEFGADFHILSATETALLDATRLASHVTLGKAILRRETQFHADGRIRAHPGFWGLFLHSPLKSADRGAYRARAAPDQDTLDWVARLRALQVAPALYEYARAPGNAVYEKIPRLFEEPATREGVYFHRSRAHGRDDFLVLVTGTAPAPRQTMVACTKGCGGDPDLIPKATAGAYRHSDEFASSFTQDRTLFPFATPADAETFERAGSWANMGFCVAYGSGHIEVAIVDFKHFEEMYEAVAASPPLAGLQDGFVEPFVCMELSSVRRNKDRLHPNLLNAIQQKWIGYPAQVVTLAPKETSLRLYKRGDPQDYDYGHTGLELLEWQRCYRAIDLPNRANIEARLGQDLVNLRARVADVHFQSILWAVFNDDITRAGPNHRANLQAIVTQYRAGTHPQQAQLVTMEQGSIAEAATLSDAVLAPTRHRMLLGIQLIHGMVGAYVAFLNHDWATDSYTGSFSGRNYNSGPRDSNEWGPLSRPSAKSDETLHAGEGVLTGHIDLGNLAFVMRDLLYGIGLITTRAPNGLVMDPTDWSEESLETLRQQRQCLLWTGSLLDELSQQLNTYFAEASRRLTDEARKRHAELMAKAKTPTEREALNKAICSWLRRDLKANMGGLPPSIRTILGKLRD